MEYNINTEQSILGTKIEITSEKNMINCLYCLNIISSVI